MVEILRGILGDKLYTIRVGELERPVYPSLAELKGRVIIKNKGYFLGESDQPDLQELQTAEIEENFKTIKSLISLEPQQLQKSSSTVAKERKVPSTTIARQSSSRSRRPPCSRSPWLIAGYQCNN
jgi:hypothetical protein